MSRVTSPMRKIGIVGVDRQSPRDSESMGNCKAGKIVIATISPCGLHDTRGTGCRGCTMLYRLKFIDALERAVLAIDIEATNDEAAVELGCAHCVGADMAVELCDGGRHVIRMTPMTARLYLSDCRNR